jgi:3-phenylpropionate/trans-cinnamate dioxygenase ferredoxin reductase subunit
MHCGYLLAMEDAIDIRTGRPSNRGDEGGGSVEVLGTVVVGAGHAGAEVAASLRKLGYAEPVAVLDASREFPHERPPLSKAFLRGEVEADELALRSQDFWSGVGLRRGERVETVDPVARRVTTASGLTIGYRALVWAAGGTARRLPVADGFAGVHSLRTLEDARRLRTEIPAARRVVIVGGGFIGLEAAAVLRERGLDVTVVEAQDRLLARVTSPVVSEYFARLHEAHGVRIVLGQGVSAVEQVAGRVGTVVLTDGTRLAADLVLVGIGLVPNVEPLVVAGVPSSNGIDVDAHGRTAVDGIFAVGDCAHRITAGYGRVRLESVPNAVQQAKLVAATIAGTPVPAEAAPWFWSHQYDTKLQTVGLATAYDDLVVRGEPGEGRFSVVYLHNGRMIAIDCVNAVREFAQGKAGVTAQAVVDRDRLADSTTDLKALLADANSVVRGG